ncbi:MAG TPA: hypothetical protein VFE98_10565 [Candidatus Bathyarchaeia archaeon]|nr:hypothetical protein [Candidatus Bathyarchaeia archaeon]
MLPTQETKQEASTVPLARPVGVTFASVFYAASGIYYLAFPIAVQDLSLLHVFLLGAFSITASYGLFRMGRLGLWLGVLLFPPHIVMPLFTLFPTLSNPGVLQQPLTIAFVTSLIVLVLFASLAILALLDKRRSFS